MADLSDSVRAPVDQHQEAAASRGFAGKLKAFGVVAVIVLAECGVALFLLPSAEETAALAHGRQAAAAEDNAEKALPPQEDGAPMREVDFGEFRISAYQPLSNTTLRIDFHLYGVVAEADVAAFEAEKAKYNHRIREDVNVIVRSSNIKDLTDAGLGLIKRKILDKTNRQLDKPYLKAIVFSDYSFLEQ